MKILLIQPPVRDFYDTSIRLHPIGLAYLKSAVETFCKDWHVRLIDFHAGYPKRMMPWPKEFAYLKSYYPCHDQSPFGAFHHYYHFGAQIDDIAEEVLEQNPDVLGLSSLFSPYYREVLEIAEAVKKKNHEIKILLGGHHVSACPDMMLEHQAVDFIIRGEGERPLVMFLKQFSSGQDYSKVPNLGYKVGKKKILNRIEDNYPINDLPIPDFSDLENKHYQVHHKPMTFILSSRGCPYQCSFCGIHTTFGRDYRRRWIPEIIDEMRLRYQQGIRVFDFEEDNLNFSKEHIIKLCQEIIRVFPQKDLTLLAMNGLSYMNLDRDILEHMKSAGFSHLNISLVSTSEDNHAENKRPFFLQKYIEVVEDGLAFGMKVTIYQIIGFPNESLASMVQTLIFHARLPVLLGPSMFYLVPGSPLAKRLTDFASHPLYLARLTAMNEFSQLCTREDIYTLFITSRIINFLKGLKGPNREIELNELLEYAHDSRTRLGCQVLDKLLQKRILFAYDAGRFVKLNKFNVELFEQIWKQLKYIRAYYNPELSIKVTPEYVADYTEIKIGV
ncbi:MAG: radical SAM protein [Chlamydiota bacterium]|nr:radical SAM protein [Chlamydiota bacterium]